MLMAARRPYPSLASVLESAAEIFARLDPADRLEAFQSQPGIVQLAELHREEDLSTFEPTAGRKLSRRAKGRSGALDELARADEQARRRFGFPLVICPVGRSVETLLEIARARVRNRKEEEIRAASEELLSWMKIRLGALFREETLANPSSNND